MTSLALPLSFNLKLPPIGKYLVLFCVLCICGIGFYGERISHEAHRDGFVGTAADQQEETRRAVIAHVKMAMASGAYQTDPKLAKEVNILQTQGEAALAGYADANFDSSADYWKLKKDGTLAYDGEGWLTGPDGKPIRDKDGKPIGAEGIEGGLANILGIDPKDKEKIAAMQNFMHMSGLLSQTEQKGASSDRNQWSWKGTGNVDLSGGGMIFITKDVEAANMGHDLNMSALMNQYGNSVAAAVFAQYYNTTTDMGIARSMGMDIGTFEERTVNDNVKDRYNTLLTAKTDFVSRMTTPFPIGQKDNYFYSGLFDKEVVGDGGKKLYPNWDYKHFGLDIVKQVGGTVKNDPFYTLADGKVVGAGSGGGSAGSAVSPNITVDMVHGYKFQDAFINTYIRSRSQHLGDAPLVAEGSFYSAGTQVGKVGDTGATGSFHYHTDVYGQPGNIAESTLNLFMGGNIFNSHTESLNATTKPNTPARRAWNPYYYLEHRFNIKLSEQPK